MMSENTTNEFISSHNLTAALRKKILDNLDTKEKAEMCFNTTQLEFDFTKNEVIISYYIVDHSYPDVSMSFDELTKLLKDKCAQI